MSTTFTGRCLIAGRASGQLQVCTSEIPGWGGIDPKTGLIVEVGHPERGQSIAGRVLVIPGAKGASGWSGQFHIARLLGNAPAAIVAQRVNTKLALGLVVLGVPALTGLPDEAYALLSSGRTATVDGDRLIVDESPTGALVASGSREVRR